MFTNTSSAIRRRTFLASVPVGAAVIAVGAVNAPQAQALPGTSSLQWNLALVGFLKYAEIDGIFGPRTKGAVQSYQSARALIPDGIPGPKTWNKLRWEVANIQRILAGNGYDLARDGFNGPITRRTVETFERNNRLPVTGVVFGATSTLLYSLG